MRPRLTVFASALAAFVLAACGGSQTTPTPGPDALSTPLATPSVALPTNLPLATATLSADVTVTRADEFGVPLDLSGPELIAQASGESVYSGYQCIITEVGCACEQPLLERSSFTFKSGQRMDYHFAGTGYAATWEMTDLGPSQWWYSGNFIDEESGQTLTRIVYLTFTETGFDRNDAVRYSTNALISCPTVSFRRLIMPTEELPAAASPTP